MTKTLIQALEEHGYTVRECVGGSVVIERPGTSQRWRDVSQYLWDRVRRDHENGDYVSFRFARADLGLLLDEG